MAQSYTVKARKKGDPDSFGSDEPVKKTVLPAESPPGAGVFDYNTYGTGKKAKRLTVKRSELARAVLMAEILGPPLAKKNAFKRRP